MGFIKELYFKPVHIDYMTTFELIVVVFGFPFLFLYGAWKYYVTKAWKEEFDKGEIN